MNCFLFLKIKLCITFKNCASENRSFCCLFYTIGRDLFQKMWLWCFLHDWFTYYICRRWLHPPQQRLICSSSLYKMFPSKWVPGGKYFVPVSSVLSQTLSPFSPYRFVNAALLVLSKGLTCGCPRQEHIIEWRPGFRHQQIL